MATTTNKILESTIEKYLISQCKKHDVFCLKNTGMNGIPDRLLLKHGRYIFVELKRPGGKPRELQIAKMDELRRHEAEVIVVDSKEKVDAVVKDICDVEKSHQMEMKPVTKVARDVLNGEWGTDPEMVKKRLQHAGYNAGYVLQCVANLEKYEASKEKK